MKIVKITVELLFLLLLSLDFHSCHHPQMKSGVTLTRRAGEDTESHGLTLFKDIMRMTLNLILGTNMRTNRLNPNEETVSITDHPYQISIEFFGRHICGGAIINSRFVVTAAHCMKLNNFLYIIRVGTSNLAQGGHLHTLVNVLKHPYYGKEHNMIFDIALVEVKPPFIFSTFVKPVDILEDPQGITEANVTGWGVAETKMGVAKYLQKRPVPVVSDEQCIAAYGEPYTDNVICGGYQAKDPCTVEGGSPLVANDQLIGIAVKAGSCVSTSNPDVFLKLAAVRVWIDDNTKR